MNEEMKNKIKEYYICKSLIKKHELRRKIKEYLSNLNSFHLQENINYILDNMIDIDDAINILDDKRVDFETYLNTEFTINGEEMILDNKEKDININLYTYYNMSAELEEVSNRMYVIFSVCLRRNSEACLRFVRYALENNMKRIKRDICEVVFLYFECYTYVKEIFKTDDLERHVKYAKKLIDDNLKTLQQEEER